jgi:hypothetical protein
MDFYDVWNSSLEGIKKEVTGVGVWTALNNAIPITLEEGVFVLGLPEKEVELRGHLQLANTTRVIEQYLTKKLGKPIKLEVIDGITINHWESVKRRRAEAERQSREATEREMKSRKLATSWDKVYDQMGRDFGKLSGKAMPQVRARFLNHCVDLCVASIQAGEMSELDERNFARCLERISQYTELPGAYIAFVILERAGRL